MGLDDGDQLKAAVAHTGFKVKNFEIWVIFDML